MTQMPTPPGGGVPPPVVKPKANVYSVLLIIAILAMAASILVVYNDLDKNYCVKPEQLFKPWPKPNGYPEIPNADGTFESQKKK